MHQLFCVLLLTCCEIGDRKCDGLLSESSGKHRAEPASKKVRKENAIQHFSDTKGISELDGKIRLGSSDSTIAKGESQLLTEVNLTL